MARKPIVSEMLCCVINNLTSIDNPKFHDKLVEFYNNDELSTAKKQIFGDYENVKNENLNRTLVDRVKVTN